MVVSGDRFFMFLTKVNTPTTFVISVIQIALRVCICTIGTSVEQMANRQEVKLK